LKLSVFFDISVSSCKRFSIYCANKLIIAVLFACNFVVLTTAWGDNSQPDPNVRSDDRYDNNGNVQQPIITNDQIHQDQGDQNRQNQNNVQQPMIRDDQDRQNQGRGPEPIERHDDQASINNGQSQANIIQPENENTGLRGNENEGLRQGGYGQDGHRQGRYPGNYVFTSAATTTAVQG